jgi:hypothetical protein
VSVDVQFISFDIISFDIVDFNYPTISEKLLNEALSWASDLTTITENDISIIKYARKSLLFGNGKLWTKKTEATVYLTSLYMGSFDGAEICELVCLFILNHLRKRFGKENIGLYRDDGLAIIKSKSARLLDKTRKELQKIFEQFDLKITAEAKLNVVNFLDVTFDLINAKHKSYTIVHQQTLKPSTKHYKTITYGYQQTHCTSLIGRTNI